MVAPVGRRRRGGGGGGELRGRSLRPRRVSSTSPVATSAVRGVPVPSVRASVTVIPPRTSHPARLHHLRSPRTPHQPPARFVKRRVHERREPRGDELNLVFPHPLAHQVRPQVSHQEHRRLAIDGRHRAKFLTVPLHLRIEETREERVHAHEIGLPSGSARSTLPSAHAASEVTVRRARAAHPRAVPRAIHVHPRPVAHSHPHRSARAHRPRPRPGSVGSHGIPAHAVRIGHLRGWRRHGAARTVSVSVCGAAATRRFSLRRSLLARALLRVGLRGLSLRTGGRDVLARSVFLHLAGRGRGDGGKKERRSACVCESSRWLHFFRSSRVTASWRALYGLKGVGARAPSGSTCA